MKLTLENCRHLTGPSLYFHSPGTVLDAYISGVPVEEVVKCWQEKVHKLREAVGWKQTPLTIRTSQNGVSLALSASIDSVYSATELNKAAWNNTVAGLSGATPEDFENIVAKLKANILQESDPDLLKLSEAAEAQGLQLLADEETVTLGLGVG